MGPAVPPNTTKIPNPTGAPIYFGGPEKSPNIPDVDPNGTFDGLRMETMRGTTKHILLPGSKWPSNQNG